MSKRLIVSSLLILLISNVTWGQKVKYKDLFPMLEAKQYDQAESSLKAFLFDPKNADHGNANLQMGYLYEQKLLGADILKDTATVYGWGDSAAMYFGKAKALIDEKELKKRDEYYQSFYRRDLRTGEFGIKISDVQLELDDRKKTAETRTENIRLVNENLKKANEQYNQAVAKFSELNGQFEDLTLLLIKSNDFTKDDLSEIKDQGRQSKRSLSKMRTALSLIENPGFGPVVEYTEITTFPETAVSTVDFYAGQFDLYELQEWAENTLRRIENEIEPLKSDLVAYDRELTDYKSNLFAGGSNGKGALSFKEDLLNNILQYDQESIIKDVIDIKLMDINMLKIYAPTLNARASDKDDVDYQLLVADSLVKQYDQLSVLVSNLEARDLDKDYEKYSFFFENRMGGRSGLDDFISEKKREVSEQSEYWKSQYDFWLETSSWALMEFGRIPVYVPESSVALPNDSIEFVTLAITRDDSLNIYPIGVKLKDKKGYTAAVQVNRDGMWYLDLDLGKMTLGDTSVTVQGKFVPSSPDQLTFYYYNPSSAKDNFIIFSVHKSGSQVWRSAMTLETEPFDVRYNETVYETIIYMDDPENAPPGQAPKYFVIDRAGKLRN